jgi:hypothetical protein
VEEVRWLWTANAGVDGMEGRETRSHVAGRHSPFTRQGSTSSSALASAWDTLRKMLTLGTILYVAILFINAIAILSEERFLARSAFARLSAVQNTR